MTDAEILDSTKSAIAEEMQRIEEDCKISSKARFNASDRWAAYHYWLGLPSVVLSSAAGAAFFKDLPDIAGAMSAVVAILAALMTFLKPSERAAAHKNNGDQYLSLKNDARVFRRIKLLKVTDHEELVGGLDEFTKRRNELNKASVFNVARRDFNKARKGIEQGEATYQVDKKDLL